MGGIYRTWEGGVNFYTYIYINKIKLVVGGINDYMTVSKFFFFEFLTVALTEGKEPLGLGWAIWGKKFRV